jgi:hypothetical protein
MTDWIETFTVGTFMGMPLAQTRAGDDECLRYDYHVKIDDRWHEVCTECFRFSPREALESLSRIFAAMAKKEAA